LSLAALSLGVLAGILEGLARSVASEPGEPTSRGYIQFDPLLGWRHRPGARVAFAQGDYAINGLGLRDRERRYETPDGVFRLMVLGDSFAEGFSVPFEDGVAPVLERAVSRPTCPVEVIAAGTVGYSTDQEYLFYREEGVRYSPRVVLLFFYYNDIIYNGRESVGRAPKPYFTFKGGVPRLKTNPIPRPEERAGEATANARWRSAALAWLRQRLFQGAPRAYDAIAATGLWPRREPTRPGAELLVYSRNPPREVLDAWAQTLNILRALMDEVQRLDARLLVVYVPSKMEVSERDWELTRLLYGVDDAVWDRRQVARWLADAGRAIGFPVIDPTDALRQQERGLQRSGYHSEGGHWNAVGHAVAALESEKALRALGVLPCASP
jgi:hypothetical protein